jgi:hypothetical protein
MKCQALWIWPAMVAVLVAGNLGLTAAYWGLRPQAAIAGPAGNGPRDDTVRDPQKDSVPQPPEKDRDRNPPKDQRPQPVTEPLAGDLLIGVLDTRFFRGNTAAWLGQLAQARTAYGPQLLGGKVYLIDRHTVRGWLPGEPLPEEALLLDNREFETTFVRAFEAVGSLARRAEKPGVKTVLLWSSDVNPDDIAPAALPVPPRRLLLLWHGHERDSERLRQALPGVRIVAFKQDAAGLVNALNFELPQLR